LESGKSVRAYNAIDFVLCLELDFWEERHGQEETGHR